MRFFLVFLLLSLTALGTDPQGEHNKETGATTKTPEETAKAKANLTEAMEKAGEGIKDLFKKEGQDAADMEKLRELSKEKREALMKAFEDMGKDADNLPASSKAMKEALDIIAMSDEKLAEELEKPEEGEKKSAFNKEKLKAELAERMKNSGAKPSAETFRAMQKLQANEKTKTVAEKLKGYGKLSEAEQDQVRAEIAKTAVRDKETRESYWSFFEAQSDAKKSAKEKAEEASTKAFYDSIYEKKLSGYEKRYPGKFGSVDVFEDKSGRKFSVGNAETYSKFLEEYKTMDAKERAKHTSQFSSLQYYEKTKDIVSTFNLSGNANGSFAFIKQTDSANPKTFTADKTISEKLNAKGPLTTTNDYDIRVWRADGKDGGSTVTSHRLQIFDTNIQLKGGTEDQPSYVQLGYTDGKYFAFNTHEGGSYTHPENLILNPQYRYNYNFAGTDSVYLQRQSDGADFKLSFDKDPKNNSISPVEFARPAPLQTYVYYNGNYYYQPVGYGNNYYYNGGYYSQRGGYYYGCST